MSGVIRRNRAIVLELGSLQAALMLALSMVASAQTAKIAVRQLPAASATSTEELASIAAVRYLANGNVLVNDQTRHRVVLLDKDLKMVKLVADSTSNTNNAYGVGRGGLIAYRGDSTLFLDPVALSMLVIDPDGKIVRTMAAPRPNDAQFMTVPSLGQPAFDAQGRLVYRMMDFGMRGMRFGAGGGPPQIPMPPDSSALVRFDLGTRKLDTLGYFKIPKTNISVSQDDRGGMRVSVTLNPLPVVDEWTVLSDGTVAFVRGQDYHIDFLDGSGKVTKAEKIPYEWQRMSDDDKLRFLDSAKVALETARRNGGVAGMAAVFGGGAPGLGGGGPTMMTVERRGDGPPRVETSGPAPAANVASKPGAEGSAAKAPEAGGGNMPPINMVNASELSDYKPVFSPSSVRADMDDRIWVRTIPTKPTPGGAIYDIIDRSGKLVDRVQVPAATTIAGFGTGGIVFLGSRDDKGIHLQRIVLK